MKRSILVGFGSVDRKTGIGQASSQWFDFVLVYRKYEVHLPHLLTELVAVGALKRRSLASPDVRFPEPQEMIGTDSDDPGPDADSHIGDLVAGATSR